MTGSGEKGAKVLVLGIGNILLQDEGIGVRVVEELQRRFHIPSEVEVLDGGTAGMALIEDIIDKEHIIILDAVRADRPPGTVIRLEGNAVPAFFQTHITPHQLGLADLLAALTVAHKRPKNTLLIGIVPESIELSLTLSERIQQQLETLIDRTVTELLALGFRLLPKQS